MKPPLDSLLGRPRLVVACVVAATALLAFQLRSLRLEVALDDLMPRGHPYRMVDEDLNEKFGAGLTAVVAVGARDEDVFSIRTLSKVASLTTAVEHLPGVVQSTVFSLTSENVRAVRRDEAGVIEVGPLLPDPLTEEAIAAARKIIADHPMYRGTLVSADGHGAMIVADFRSDAPMEEVTDALEAIAQRERDVATEVLVGGQPPALAALQGATRRIFPMIGLAVAVIALVHLEAFRTWQAMLLPLVTAGLSVIWSLGLTSLLGVHLTPWTALTAILVLSVAAGHAVQILKRYYECYREFQDNEVAVAESLRRIGPVMVTAGLVAAGGFASLASFGVPAVRDFGLVAACGIVSTLIIEMTFIPSVRLLLGAPRVGEAGSERENRILGPAIERVGAVVVSSPGFSLACSIVAVGVVASGICLLRVNTSFRSWFSDDTPMMVAEREIRERFTGTSTIRILVTSEAEGGLLEPAVLRGIGRLQEAIAREPDVTSSASIVDYVRLIHDAMSEDDGSDVDIPEDRELVAQYLVFFGSDEIAHVLSADERAAVIHALARSDSVAWVEDLFSRLRALATEVMPAGVRVQVAGGELAQAAANNETVVREKLWNIAQVSGVIFALSAMAFRSLVGGLFVLAPLACALLVSLGVMGWVGTPLSFATATYASMGVSLGADFAIYLLFRIREQRAAGSLEEAIREALRTSGKAIFFVASAIAAGYATLLLSDFALWRQLGAYVGMMMCVAALATLVILPALVVLVRPRFLSQKGVVGSGAQLALGKADRPEVRQRRGLKSVDRADDSPGDG